MFEKVRGREQHLSSRAKHHVKDISELRERIVATWDELDQRIINRPTAVGQWRTRLCACVKAPVDISSTNCDLLYHISCTYVS